MDYNLDPLFVRLWEIVAQCGCTRKRSLRQSCTAEQDSVSGYGFRSQERNSVGQLELQAGLNNMREVVASIQRQVSKGTGYEHQGSLHHLALGQFASDPGIASG
jgi:hypothetical protein